AIEVRLRSRTGGAFAVSLLPRRRDGMPEEIDVSGAADAPLTISAFHEDWYQDVDLADLASALRNGTTWYPDRPEGRLQWMRTGRDLYVLAPGAGLSGYVSTPRLTLDEEHVVLCTSELQGQVLALLEQSCDTAPLRIDAADGLPVGWVGFRGIRPIRALPAGP